MNFKRIGMAIVSLVLVACLVVNVSPVKAEATSFGLLATLASAPAAPVIGAVLVGLGVCVGIVTTDWDNVVDRAVSYFTDQGVIDLNGNIDIYSLTGAGYQYGIAESLISGIRDWAFENEIVSENTVLVADGYWLYNGYELRPYRQDVDLSVYPYIYIGRHNGFGDIATYFCSAPMVVFRDYKNYYPFYSLRPLETANILVYEMDTSLASGWILSNEYTLEPDGYGFGLATTEWNNELLWSNCNLYGTQDYNYGQLILSGSEPVTDGTTTFDIASGLVAGHIASVADSIAEGYQKWAEKYVDLSVLDPDLPAAVYPLSYSPSQTLTDIHGLTQEEAWAGILSGVTLPDEDVTTKPDIGDISLALGDISASVFLNALADRIETLPLIPPRIEDAIEQLPIIIRDIRDSITTFPIWQDNLLNHIEQLPIYIGDIRDLIETFPDTFVLGWEKVLEGVRAIPLDLSRWLDDIKADTRELKLTLSRTYEDIGTKVAEGIKTAVVPEKDYLTDKVNALLEEYAFAGSIVTTAKAIKLGLAGIATEPPVIYIHLQDNRGSYNLGGTVPFLDLRWYAEYKPTVDNLISAFLWICFAWKMLVKLPGIISGMPGDFVMDSVHHVGMSEAMPVRSKEYEIQRINSRQITRRGRDG